MEKPRTNKIESILNMPLPGLEEKKAFNLRTLIIRSLDGSPKDEETLYQELLKNDVSLTKDIFSITLNHLRRFHILAYAGNLKGIVTNEETSLGYRKKVEQRHELIPVYGLTKEGGYQALKYLEQ